MVIKKILKNIKKRFYLDKEILSYIDLNKKRFLSNNFNEQIVLVDFIDSYPLIETYSYLTNYIAQKNKLQIKYFKFDYDKLDLITFFKNPKLVKIYSSFNAQKGFSYNFKYIPFSIIETIKLFRKIGSKKDVLNIRYLDIEYGELLYDTYLRRYNQATLSIDKKLFYLIFLSIWILKSIDNYFNIYSIKTVIPGDVAYIYSGLIAKYAIKENIDVLSIVETNGLLITKLKDINYYRRMPYWNYRKQFNQFSQHLKRKALCIAKYHLENRLNGNIDRTLSYMKTSAYQESGQNILNKNNKIKILISLHDFFDSPHIYRWMLFEDFWEWITYTLNLAINTNYEWYIKPHPNGLSQNKIIIDKLKRIYASYKNIIFLNPLSSNKQIINEKINAVVTVYGSVAHEFAYKNILVINAGDNPHIEYNFNYHSKTKEEYRAYLLNIDKLLLQINKNEILEFFYMHYIYFKPLKILNPVYPNQEFIKQYNLSMLNSKSKRIFYHKDEKSLEYFIKTYDAKNDYFIYMFFNKVI